MNQGQVFTLVYLIGSLLLFINFMYLAFWFIFFNEGPTAWLKNNFYLMPQLSVNATSSSSTDSDDLGENVKVTLTSNKHKIALILLGLACALVAYVLFIGM